MPPLPSQTNSHNPSSSETNHADNGQLNTASDFKPQELDNNQIQVEYHPLINSLLCDHEGNFLPEYAAPPSWNHAPPDDFSPYMDHHQFEVADLLFQCTQMAADNVNNLMQVWAARHSNNPPFYSKEHLHEEIDSTALSNILWKSFTVYYNGSIEEGDVEAALWKAQGWDVWLHNARIVLHNQLGNTDIGKNFDVAAQCVYDQNGKQ
ncbi:hypothetical protein C0992_000556 [Termitomyces sp. T32_za158]|nr:hypothetical protein C0992_000556 [Termitomyces sp. T32_za158]